MANLEPILKAWNQYVDTEDFREHRSTESISKWVDSLILLLEIFGDDSQFKNDLLIAASKFYSDNFFEDGHDTFFYLLGKIVRK